MDAGDITAYHHLNPHHQVSNIALWKSHESQNAHSSTQSEFVALKGTDYDVFAEPWGPATATASVGTRSTTRQNYVVAHRSFGNTADAVANDRIKFLAAKYATKGNDREITARLEILNNRLLSLVPTVTEAQISFLEKMADTLLDLERDTEQHMASVAAIVRK